MVNEILTGVSTVGFPILACIYMWKSLNKTIAFYQEALLKQTTLIESIDRRLTNLEKNIEKED